MPSSPPPAHLLELGAAAAMACCAAAAAAWYLQQHTQSGEQQLSSAAFCRKAQRWLGRHAPSAWRNQASAQHGPLDAAVLEPGEQPWPSSTSQGGWPAEPPQCRPVCTVTQLLTWAPPTQQPDPCACSTPLCLPSAATTTSSSSSSSNSSSSTTTASRPHLLVCHDMMGGYLQYESLLSGSDEYGEYRIWHWDSVDVFVYFSHHLVTMPPAGWIHAAHKHGTKVLGTLITEFGQGRLRCDRLFSSHETARRVADQLVAIAAHYGFEGWLVNIENPLTPQQVSVMQHFVGYLRARTRDTVGPHGMVVWYDAVTTAGQLRWQNGLTPLNAPFFDLSDALFVNYTWTPDTLSPTTAAAGARAASVFMGVDVFGRGSYGGGGWGVVDALAAAAAAGLSAALFAPGWVRENLDKARFHELQDRWWHSVQHTWRLSHPVVTRLPFSTSFNTGAGLAWFEAGAPSSAAAPHGLLPAAAAGAAALEAASNTAPGESASSSSGSSSGSGWYNLLATNTLPCVRDPVTQQVVTGGLVGGYLSGCTAYEGGSCFVICQQQQQQQQQEQQEQQESAGAEQLPSLPADAGAGDATASSSTGSSCCCPMVPVAADASSGSSSRQLGLLQLFTAHVPVGSRDCEVALRCVYAAAAPPAAAPVLWLMVSSPASADDNGSSTQRLLLLPDARSSAPGSSSSVISATATSALSRLEPPAATSSQLQQQQQAEVSSVDPVLVQLVPQQQQQLAGESSAGGGRRVQLLQPPTPPPAADVTDEGAAQQLQQPSQPSWLSPLGEVVGSWEWVEAGWRLCVPAGAVITGVGVAVEVVEGRGGVDVLALLGRVEVDLVVGGQPVGGGGG